MSATTVQPHPSVLFTRLDSSQAALLHLETKAYFTLNETGIRIWQMLEEGETTEAISAALQEEYDLDEAKADSTVTRFLGELGKEGLLAAAP